MAEGVAILCKRSFVALQYAFLEPYAILNSVKKVQLAWDKEVFIQLVPNKTYQVSIQWPYIGKKACNVAIMNVSVKEGMIKHYLYKTTNLAVWGSGKLERTSITKTTPKKLLPVAEILKRKDELDPILEILELLQPIFYSNPDQLSKPEKNFCLVEDFESAINGDGFDAYFFNGNGDYCHETIAALREIGSVSFLRILESAAKVFPGGRVPKDQNERQDILEKLGEKASDVWERLDGEFYKYEEDLTALVLKYVESNLSYFR